MSRLIQRSTIASALFVVGCASTPPSKNLLTARAAYQEARTGDAARVEPEYVSRAQDALNIAERAHENDPKSEKEKHLAYLAHRKALLAMAVTEHTKAKQDEQRWESEYVELLAQQRDSAQQKAKSQTLKLQDARESAAETQSALKNERAARRQAESKLADVQGQLDSAMATIGELSKVERKDKELIITLNGAVLFELGKSSLLPTAKRKLREVAKVLKEQQSGRSITIEGHTDAQGTKSANLNLSKARADAV
ncbi:MAG: OmpA family protein, partial [Myxococcota bacterium]